MTTQDDTGRPYLLVKYGESAPQRFDVARHGTRLGRSSANDIHFPDGALSRNHCMFEHDGDGICVIDLGSANGTKVNGETIGEGKRRLSPGDSVTAGDVEIAVAKDDRTVVAAPRSAAAQPDVGSLFGETPGGGDGDAARREEPDAAQSRMRVALWAVAGVLAAAVVVLLALPSGGGADGAKPPRDARTAAKTAKMDTRLVTFDYERIDADETHILRYAAKLDAAGTLSVEYDDSLPGDNRRVRKSKSIDKATRKRIEDLFATDEWIKLDSNYTGVSAESENYLRRIHARSVWRAGVKDVTVENAPAPRELEEISQTIEALANNELGVTIGPTKAELAKRARKSEETGDRMWDERDVELPNLWLSAKNYKLAKEDWIMLGSNMENVSRVQKKLDEAEAELKRRHDDERIDSERAKNIGDWERARTGFRRICDMIPDRNDRRHQEADNHLVDIEQRMRAAKRGARAARRGREK